MTEADWDARAARVVLQAIVDYRASMGWSSSRIEPELDRAIRKIEDQVRERIPEPLRAPVIEVRLRDDLD